MKRNLPRHTLACLLPLSTLVLATAASASDLPICYGYPAYQEGATYVANDKVRHNGYGYNCSIGHWCSGPTWAFEPGAGSASSDAWSNLGECSITEPNQPPQVSLNAKDKVAYGSRSYISATISDPDSNLVSWNLSIYKDVDGQLVDGITLAEEQLPATDSAVMSGYWQAPSINSSSSSSSSGINSSSSSSSSGASSSSNSSSSSSSSGITFHADTLNDSLNIGTGPCSPDMVIITSTAQPGTSSSSSSSGSTNNNSNNFICSTSSSSSSSSSGGVTKGDYVVVATATDSHGAQGIQKQAIQLAYRADHVSLSYSETTISGQTLTVSGNVPPQSINLTVSPYGYIRRIEYGGGGSPGNYSSGAIYSWSPRETGMHTLIGSAGSAQTEAQVMVFANQQPLATLAHPSSIEQGDNVELYLNGMDYTSITSLTLNLNGLELTPTQETPIGLAQIYGLEQKYQWSAIAGEHQLYAEVIDNDNNVSFIETLITVQGVNPDSCVTQMIDISNANAYPNWPQLNWQGQPNNASNGDLMRHQQKVFRAKWWTQSAPGSDDSWAYICDL